MKCPRCGYEWESKIPQPKECPRCKGRLDYGSVGASRVRTEKKEVQKEMTSKLPWVAAATIIVIVVGLGAWALLGQAPAGTASISAVAGQGVVFADVIPGGNASGIENVYIITSGYTETENLSGHANIIGVIETSTGSCNIAYETTFHIVVAVKVGSDNMAYVRIDNMNVGLGAYGSFTIADENVDVSAEAHMATWSHDNSGYDTNSGWLRINAVWDNNGTGYKLPANGTLNLENIMLWGWK